VGPPGTYDSPALTIVSSMRSVVSAFSSHLDPGYANFGEFAFHALR
jgi:hypothetical protein